MLELEEGHDPIEAAQALIAAGKAGEAAQGLKARLAAGRGGLLARLTLVEALVAAGDTQGALEEAREAVSLNPNIAVAVLGLGEALLAADVLPTAIAELQRALRIDPDLPRARELIAVAWLKAGEADKALEALGALERSPQVDAMIAAAQAIKTAPRSDAGYVRHLFDQFSADYDARMIGQLSYAGPQILLDLAAMVMPGRLGASAGSIAIAYGRATIEKGLSILDLGCGTGLVADLETALAEAGPRYDLILAADTLVYLGDLRGVFNGVRARLAPEGYFLFTTEAKSGDGFELGPKRRWRHSDAYLRATAQAAGLSLAGLVAATPRFEANQPVEGFAVALTA